MKREKLDVHTRYANITNQLLNFVLIPLTLAV